MEAQRPLCHVTDHHMGGCYGDQMCPSKLDDVISAFIQRKGQFSVIDLDQVLDQAFPKMTHFCRGTPNLPNVRVGSQPTPHTNL